MTFQCGGHESFTDFRWFIMVWYLVKHGNLSSYNPESQDEELGGVHKDLADHLESAPDSGSEIGKENAVY